MLTPSVARHSNRQASVTMKQSNHRAVLIFDWDDTICPSSFVDKSQIETFSDLPVHVRRIGMCHAVSCSESFEWDRCIPSCYRLFAMYILRLFIMKTCILTVSFVISAMTDSETIQ